jgi:hypothetical protein
MPTGKEARLLEARPVPPFTEEKSITPIAIPVPSTATDIIKILHRKCPAVFLTSELNM